MAPSRGLGDVYKRQVLYVLTAIWTFLLKKAGLGNVLILVNNLIPVLMGLFTAWFQKWYPARMARGKRK